MTHNHVVGIQIIDDKCMAHSVRSQRVTLKDCQLMSSHLVICHRDISISCLWNESTAKLILFVLLFRYLWKRYFFKLVREPADGTKSKRSAYWCRVYCHVVTVLIGAFRRLLEIKAAKTFLLLAGFTPQQSISCNTMAEEPTQTA